MTEFLDVSELAARVPDESAIAVVPDYSGVAMAATVEIIRREVRGLHLVCVPISGLQADLLIGAGCVATIESSAVTLGEYGGAPRFNAAVTGGTVRMLDATCPAIHAALGAAEKGVPFATLRGLIGSDILAHRADWKTIDNPFAPGDPIVALPALQPDIALFHAHRVDRSGNVWVGRRREQVVLAHAAKATLVTFEELVDENLLDDEATAAGVLPALYVAAVAEAKSGAWPVGMWEKYPVDDSFMRSYASAARSDGGFQRILTDLLAAPAHAAAE